MSIRPSTLDPCNIRSSKFAALLVQPLGEKMPWKLPGIGVSTSKKLEKSKGITRAKDLLKEYIHTFRSDHEQFRLWLMEDYAVPEYRATECTIALIDYIEQAKKHRWSLPTQLGELCGQFFFVLMRCVEQINTVNDLFRASSYAIEPSFNNLLFSSTMPQAIQTGDIICIPSNIPSLQAILLNLPSGMIVSPELQSVDGNQSIRFTSRAYLYVQLSPPLLTPNQRCFRVNLGLFNTTGQIQFVYKIGNVNTKELRTLPVSFDPCATRRVKCRNGGRCQALSNGQTKCLCPDHISGNDCENIGIRCSDLICINGATCSSDNQSCQCSLGTQGPDCSIRCGESHIQPNISSNRIVNGESAVKHSWPYIVYIQIGDYGWCSGSLIDSWTVLTAAHCTYDRDLDEFVLWFGVHKLDEREMEMDMGIVEMRLITEIINHPNYQIYPIKTFANDLAILRLAEAVHETAYIRYLCILPTNHRVGDVQLDAPVEIIGWGYINKILADGSMIRRTNELQQASIRILPDHDCLEYTKNDLVLFQSKLMICAGTKDYKTDSCQGDSGGPLLMEYQHRWYAVGIVSFGSVQCAKQGAAGVYTRLSMYSDWISFHMRV